MPARDATRTAAGTILGTPAYMSPEQAQGRIEALDERSDVYSLGAILYEILTLARPIGIADFDGAGAVQKAARGEIPPPSEQTGAPWPMPRELEAVVSKAMAFDPRQRYASASALRADLDRFHAGKAVGALGYSPLGLALKWARRNKPAVVGRIGSIRGVLGLGKSSMAP